MGIIEIAVSTITNPYFGIIFAFGILSLPFVFKHKKSANQIQVIVTTAGMFGTFLGVVAGISLLDLDINQINESISNLIGGLSTAFLTSLAGLFSSLLIQVNPKGFPYHLPEKLEDTAEQETSLEEVLAELKILNKNIAGDDESSLSTQIVKLRSDSNDNHKELKKSFDDFAKQMAENNVNALIEAVQKVMEDFNAKINDQLGENFKRLSEATENLVTWQDQYRDQLATVVEALGKSNEVLKTSFDSMSAFVDHAKEFDNTATQLKESLEAMGASMTGLKKLADTLEGSGQEIRDEMSQITKENIKELGENLKGISEKLVEDYSYLQKMMQTVIDKGEKEK